MNSIMKKLIAVILSIIVLVVFLLVIGLIFIVWPTYIQPNNTKDSFDKKATIKIFFPDIPEDTISKLSQAIKSNTAVDADTSFHSYPSNIFYNSISATLTSSVGPDIIMIDNKSIINIQIPSDELVPLNNLGIESNLDDGPKYYTDSNDLKPYALFYNATIFNEQNLNAKECSFDDFLIFLDKLSASGFTPIAFGAKDQRCLKNTLTQLVFSSQYEDPWTIAHQNFNAISPYFSEAPNMLDYDDAKMQFKDGKAILFFGLQNEYAELKEDCDFKIDVLKISQGKNHVVWHDYAGIYVVNNNTSDKFNTISVLKALLDLNASGVFTDAEVPSSDSNSNLEYCENWMYRDDGTHLLDYLREMESLQYSFF